MTARALAALLFSAPALSAPLTLELARTANQAEAANTVKLLQPYLTAALGREVKVSIAADYDELSARLAAGKTDLAWIPPLPFVRAQLKNSGVKPIAKVNRGGALFYRSVLFTKGGEGAPKTLADLKGKTVAWVDRASTSGYTFPSLLFVREGHDPKTFFGAQKFLGGHDAVCRAVLAGTVDAGATFANEPVAGQPLKLDGCRGVAPDEKLQKLVVIAQTEPISNDVVAARPNLAPADAKVVHDVLVKMKESEEGKKILKAVFQADGFDPAQEGDFEHVRAAQKLLTGK